MLIRLCLPLTIMVIKVGVGADLYLLHTTESAVDTQYSTAF